MTPQTDESIKGSPARWHGTVLLCTIGALVLLNSAISIFFVRRAKQLEAPVRQCTLEKWRWIGALEELEWNFRRWEMLAPLCLERGVPIVEKLEKGDGYRIWNFEMSQSSIREATSTTILIPEGHSFISGAPLWLCNENDFYRANVSTVALTGQSQVALTLEFLLKARPERLPKGTILATARLQEYQLVPRKDGSGFTLISQESRQPPRPVFSGISSFSISVLQSTSDHKIPITFTVKSGECELNRSFSLKTSHPNSMQGRWMLSGESMTFLPWFDDSLAGAPKT